MGYCKHEWQRRSEVLRAVFAENGPRIRDFVVCVRCLKIAEVPESDERAPGGSSESNAA